MDKSSLERVSNAVCDCIDNIHCELCHESAMNVILRFLAKYKMYVLCVVNNTTTCSCTYTGSAQLHIAIMASNNARAPTSSCSVETLRIPKNSLEDRSVTTEELSSYKKNLGCSLVSSI